MITPDSIDQALAVIGVGILVVLIIGALARR